MMLKVERGSLVLVWQFCVVAFMVFLSSQVRTRVSSLALSQSSTLNRRFRHTSFTGTKWRLRAAPTKRFFVRPSTVHMMPEGPEVRTVVDQLRGGGAIGRRLVDIQFLSGRYVRHGRPKGFDEFAKTMTPWFQPHNAAQLAGQSVDIIQDWNAKGKFIYLLLDNGKNPPDEGDDYQRSIWITLGMSGHLVNEGIHRQDPRYARWQLETLDPDTGHLRSMFYHDQRNFGTLRFSLSMRELQEKLNSLGPDILESTTTEKDFLEIIEKQQPNLNVCKFLMDQTVSSETSM